MRAVPSLMRFSHIAIASGEGLEAFLSHTAVVVGAPAVTEATYGKTATTVLMTARLPVEDEGTLRHVGDSAVQL